MCCCCCLDIAPRAQLIKRRAGLLHPIVDNAPPTTRDRRTVVQRCYSHIRLTGLDWWLLELAIHYETMEVAGPRRRPLVVMQVKFTCSLN